MIHITGCIFLGHCAVRECCCWETNVVSVLVLQLILKCELSVFVALMHFGYEIIICIAIRLLKAYLKLQLWENFGKDDNVLVALPEGVALRHTQRTVHLEKTPFFSL